MAAVLADWRADPLSGAGGLSAWPARPSLRRGQRGRRQRTGVAHRRARNGLSRGDCLCSGSASAADGAGLYRRTQCLPGLARPGRHRRWRAQSAFCRPARRPGRTADAGALGLRMDGPPILAAADAGTGSVVHSHGSSAHASADLAGGPLRCDAAGRVAELRLLEPTGHFCHQSDPAVDAALHLGRADLVAHRSQVGLAAQRLCRRTGALRQVVGHLGCRTVCALGRRLVGLASSSWR